MLGLNGLTVLTLIEKGDYALARMNLFYKKSCKFTPVLSAKCIFNSEHIYIYIFKILNIFLMNI
jgi:hypothetical protein